ncbi:MAG TPA: sugar transferase [Chloroflexia bacterium]|nr:sugar transferase [Chloroflexia bacterium]
MQGATQEWPSLDERTPSYPSLPAAPAPSPWRPVPATDQGAARALRSAVRRRRVLLLTTAPGTAPAGRPAGLTPADVVVGTLALDTAPPRALPRLIARSRADRLVVLLSEHAPVALRDPILTLHRWGLPVQIVPWSPLRRGAAGPARERYRVPLHPREARRKRLLDLALTIPALVVALPIMLVCALIIRWDSPGPAIFRQRRFGLQGAAFQMYKLRTMYHQPEAVEASQRPDPAPHAVPADLFYKLPDDPRITRVGRFLRRTSLDELPQLFNVLRGEMSLVGPRPALPWVVEYFGAWQLARFAVPPGMTGWWQVTGRSNNPLHLSTDTDLYYLDHYSLWLDLRILARTVLTVLRGTGAY